MTEAGAGSLPARAPFLLRASSFKLARGFLAAPPRLASVPRLIKAAREFIAAPPRLTPTPRSFKAERGFLAAPPCLASVPRSIKAARRYETVDASIFERGLERVIRRSATSCIQDACKIDWAGARPEAAHA